MQGNVLPAGGNRDGKRHLMEIITPDRVFYKGTADLLEFNTESARSVYIVSHSTPTTVLEPGLVTIHHGDEEQVAAVHAGLAEILGDR